VPERVQADGSVRRPLDARALEARAAALVKAGVTSIAIVFLHAYANPRHEAQAAKLIARRHRGVAVTTSHEVAPEIREFERASTTVGNAYIKPLAQRYLELMAKRVAELRIPAPLLLCPLGPMKTRRRAAGSWSPRSRRPIARSSPSRRPACPSSS
jgi:N-methylhydantoinase A